MREWGRYFVTGMREMVCCRSAGDVLLQCIVFCIHDPPQHKIALFGYHECMPNQSYPSFVSQCAVGY